MTMEDKIKHKRGEESSLDMLLGTKPLLKPKRKVGRLPQLNKRSRLVKRGLGQWKAEDACRT